MAAGLRRAKPLLCSAARAQAAVRSARWGSGAAMAGAPASREHAQRWRRLEGHGVQSHSSEHARRQPRASESGVQPQLAGGTPCVLRKWKSRKSTPSMAVRARISLLGSIGSELCISLHCNWGVGQDKALPERQAAGSFWGGAADSGGAVQVAGRNRPHLLVVIASARPV